MSYSAYNCAFLASREAVPGMLGDDDGLEAADRYPQLHAASRNAALASALCALAAALAPQALGLFLRPWKLNERGVLGLEGGRYADALVDDALSDALAATDALVAAWSEDPMTMAYVLQPEFREYEGEVGKLAGDIRGTALAAGDASPEEAFATFGSHHEEQDLHLSALFAWLQVFASMLRTARSRDAAVVHVAWF